MVDNQRRSIGNGPHLSPSATGRQMTSGAQTIRKHPFDQPSRPVLLLVAFLALAAAIIAIGARAPTSAAPATASAVDAYDKVAELLRPDSSGIGNLRSVAAVGDYAYALTTGTNGVLVTFDTSSVGDAGFVSLGVPVATLPISGKSGLVRSGTMLYTYGTDGVQPVDITQPDQPVVGQASGGPTLYNAVLADGYLVGAGRGAVAVYQLLPEPTLIHTATIGANSVAYGITVLGDTVLASYYEGSTNGLKIFQYTTLEDLGTAKTVATSKLVYHLRGLGDRLVACTSDSLDLYDITDPTNPVFLSQTALGGSSWGRACVLDGENLVTNGDIVRLENDTLTPVDSFVPDRTLSDGFPYTAVAEGNHVYMPQTSRVLMLTRAPSTTSPEFELIPDWGGLGTEIGARAVASRFGTCDWSPGETVEIRWDNPSARLASFTVDAEGCFEGLVRLDDTELLASSPDGSHTVTAIGSVSGAAQVPFEQVRPRLNLAPAQGPVGRTVALSGCAWGTADYVDVIWTDTGTVLTQARVDGSGCITGTLTIPRAEDDMYALQAIANHDARVTSAAAYWLQSATVLLTPAEGPAGSRVPLAGWNWFPNETVEFIWLSTGELIESWTTNDGGYIVFPGPNDPYLRIPNTAALGEHTIRAVGMASRQTVDTPFTVIERTLVFNPNGGYPGDTVVTSGCGWVGNSQVTIEWGYPDTNNLPIRWSAPVDPTTGCFGAGGAFSINVPLNTITGEVEATATGNVAGTASAVFTVFHDGQISFPVTSAYAGDTIEVVVTDAIVGESITFIWDDGTPFDATGAATPNFTDTVVLPTSASIGTHTVTAEGTKGFNDQAVITILDNSEIAVTTSGAINPGHTIRVAGTNWGSGEIVTLKLGQGTTFITTLGSATVPDDAQSFSTSLSLPMTLEGGTYTLRAEGDKGRVADTSLTITGFAFNLTAGYVDPAPRLDGTLGWGEWNYDQRANFENGFISVQSDESRLYLLINVLDDTGEDPVGTDNFWLTFDIWANGQIDPGFDLNFRLDSAGDFILEAYSGPGSFSPRNSTLLRSAYGAGFACFYADGSRAFTFDGFLPVFSCTRHRVWEVGIDLHTLGLSPGDAVRMGVRTISQSPSFTEDFPANFTTDFSELGVVALAPSQLTAPPNGTVLDIGSGGFEIEVTQAIQDADNSLPLVARKETVVRVYPAVAAESMVRVFLFGQRDGVDLPGSPLVMNTVIPPAIDRELGEDTANFLLPPSWTEDGITSLVAVAENLDGSNTTAVGGSVIFRERRVPHFWIVPINTGTAASPVLPAADEIALQQSYLEATFPLHDVQWTLRPWQDLGATMTTTLGIILDDINDLYSDTAFGYLNSGRELSEMPEVIYGFVPNPPRVGGLADAVWAGGAGIAGAGNRGTSEEGVMAHEIVHLLDRSAAGTWGRHVGTTDSDFWQPNGANFPPGDTVWGCGASGTDPNWEAAQDANDEIGNIGYDSRLPWSLGAGTPRTVIPSNYPDLMSYCQSRSEANGVSGQLPTKWISPYRWRSLFTKFTPTAATRAQSATINDVYYISGELRADGTGTLKPVKVLPGVSTPIIAPGDYTLEIQDAGGTPLLIQPFLAGFINVEGEAVETVYFQYRLPAQTGGQRIVLKRGDDVLDTIVASPNAPTVSITAPSGGESWSGEATIAWSSDDQDGDALTFSLFYSPDGGATWTPVVSNITGNSTIVDVTRLPGGSGGKIRIIATDGFHTVEADSSGTFTVPDPDILVAIQSPKDGERFQVDEVIDLKGIANDVVGTPFSPEGLVWSVDGEVVDGGTQTKVQLAEGTHTVTLTAYDGTGARGESSVTIEVLPPAGAHTIFLPVVIRGQ